MFQNTRKLINEPSSNLFQTESSEFRLGEIEEIEAIDLKYGFEKLLPNSEKVGYLVNMHSTEILDEGKRLCSAVDYYFLQENGDRFKAALPYCPYFYVLTEKNLIQETERFLSKKYAGIFHKIEIVTKEDLDLPNHLAGLKRDYLKLSFYNQTDLVKVRKEILREVRKNSSRQNAVDTFYNEMLRTNLHNTNDDYDDDGTSNSPQQSKSNTHQMENILDIREYDVPYHIRVSIDKRIFCGIWYRVKTGNRNNGGDDDNDHCSSHITPLIEPIKDLVDSPEPIVLAFDIETTKMPLKFPDAATDQIMMISYMIDGQGFLITNREILSADINNFEYTPKPEFEGKFTVFNASNEAALLQKFFDHIMIVRPNIFVTYNGDFFDWPFVETRAAAHNLDMKKEIGFSADNAGVYWCRSAIHMDCLCWVKRDSYLPVGSQNLKAVAKAKLRYDPVELDPEEMCPLAVSDPQVLSNYSVSDAVATYYLYMQYVHPFIFALCTIIPCEPDEVLRKGSGTLCESLLMVEAFHANIIFPNKQETILNKMTHDGHVIIQETYVGGHVEALESGIFRADIPCRFRISESAVDTLINQIPKTLEHAITVEEGIPLENVLNLDDVTQSIRKQLLTLKEQPLRLERPLIYHLDVGAMYPNIILTNRLQPYASITNDATCAQCNFNKPNALCKRNMQWMMREEYMPASRNEYQRIQQQLEMEKFPYSSNIGQNGNSKNHGQRAFHELSQKEQAELEKARLQVYCRKVYKKLKVTRIEERTTTICQKENSFYVDTVRAFRDRRYEYKTLAKQAKRNVQTAQKLGNLAEIKTARNREILYDSLQLAHKCILNSFYGYVMRTGARWYSMEMAGIVCNTGAAIITEARKIIEQIGRPLELDTDGIWCVLPASFPENYQINTNLDGKKSVIISYVNAVLNSMVKENFTNKQYHELVRDTEDQNVNYVIRSENSIFFEVDGPYKAMVLPASKEEGKKLKKRYAVFNFDGSIAELKGFEIKRRGELQLIKNFQSSIFEAFLKGDTLESCYAAVAQVADYWLDILYSHGKNLPDSELFDLISENRSMSKKLEEYGQQKSTSISTAKRLAEFLGDEMVKDAGLACKYIISRKPEKAPVTERAIPLAIFQAKAAVQKYHLRKWLKDASIDEVNIRDILDWNYYIERLGGAIQKIITIPAAMQGVSNPVPRVQHPTWLFKKIREKHDTFKQRKITDIFSTRSSESETMDIEDLGKQQPQTVFAIPKSVTTATKRKRNKQHDQFEQFTAEDLNKSWIEVLGNPPRVGDEPNHDNYLEWLKFHKKKWLFQMLQRQNIGNMNKRKKFATTGELKTSSKASGGTLGSFLQKKQRSLFSMPWQIIQIVPFGTTTVTDEFTVWALLGNTEQYELHSIKLIIPRQYYANLRTPKASDEGALFRKCNRILPRSKQCHHLYLYTIPEQLYQDNNEELLLSVSDPNVEGIYETKTPLLFRALLTLGCICKVSSSPVAYPFNSNSGSTTRSFTLNELERIPIVPNHYYLGGKDSMKRIFLYHHRHLIQNQHIFGLFLTPLRKCLIVVIDSVRVNLMPAMNSLYARERAAKLEQLQEDSIGKSYLPPESIQFEIKVDTDLGQGLKLINKALNLYKEEKKGPTMVILQTILDDRTLRTSVSALNEFPFTRIHIKDNDGLFNVLEWQKIGANRMLHHYINSEKILDYMIQQCRYLQIPLGNYPNDPALFGCDILYARYLMNANHVLWCSSLDAPDLGGSEENDTRLLTDYYREKASEVINKPGWYSSICLEFDINCLAVATLLQSHHVTDIKGEIRSDISNFSGQGSSFIDDIFSSNGDTSNGIMPSYDDSNRCMEAFRLLRYMASAWVRDISLNKNQFADFQLIHLYRWLRSSKAFLYEPALLHILQMLMKKLFLQFVAEFKRLGCTVIYANYNKIVICMRKYKSEDALASAEFIINSIRNKELFHSIDITLNKCYDHLVWLDSANFCGIQSKLSEDDVDNHVKDNKCNNAANNDNNDDADDDEDDDNNDKLDIKMDINWHLAERLPIEANCRENFKIVITSYITAIYMKFKEKQHNSTIQPLMSSQSVALGLTDHDDILDYAKEIISGEISQSLFKMTEIIYNYSKEVTQKSSSSSSSSSTSIDNDHIIVKNPALEFVKSVCRILNLDPSLELEVNRLRSNLLCLIGVGEFSDEAAWDDNNDKSETYVIPQIICQRCNHCRDIDLNRDPFRKKNQNVWYCPLCKAIYDNVEIENFLLDVISKNFLAYNLQDLRCSKCFEVKMENFQEHCKCASDFKCLITSSQDFLSLLNTFLKLAKKFVMPALEETIERLLKLI